MKILFVCLGNICRSPLAEAIFNHKIKAQKLDRFFEADSCGTGNYHIGGPADSRTISIALKNNVDIDHVARQLSGDDLIDYDQIIAMDQSNYANILRITSAKENKHKVQLMREYDPAGRGDVPDPYHGTEKDFQEVFEILDRSMDHFIKDLKTKIGLASHQDL
jgi:protein-tyrosine phosphatase